MGTTKVGIYYRDELQGTYLYKDGIEGKSQDDIELEVSNLMYSLFIKGKSGCEILEVEEYSELAFALTGGWAAMEYGDEFQYRVLEEG